MVAQSEQAEKIEQAHAPARNGRWSFSTADYHRMAEVGILSEDDRVELIDGEIRLMSPISSRHASIVNRMNAFLSAQFGKAAIVSIQNSIILNDKTEPQPDLVLLRFRDDFYEEATPTAADVLLLIEVSDSTLAYDRQEKLPRYAQAGIPEVWLIVLEYQIIEHYAGPNGTQYEMKQTFKRGQTIALPIAQLTIAVDDIFGQTSAKS